MAPVAETPRTPVSKVSQFWTPPWRKNKALPLLSSPSPVQPSSSTPCIIRSSSQTSRSSLPMSQSAVPPAGPLPTVFPSTHEGPSKGHEQQDLHHNRRDEIEKGIDSASIPHIDSSVLPRSPPFLMSPPLEAALLFTSTSCGALGFASFANLSPKLGSRSPPTSNPRTYAAAYDSPLSSKTKFKIVEGQPRIIQSCERKSVCMRSLPRHFALSASLVCKETQEAQESG
ncbi:hypothetical protein DFH29DRAFT_193748 [Suillus ampliporus]|nr:hypothetical protein DFH29DRAFT_193748 [Suillus ampliporus]